MFGITRNLNDAILRVGLSKYYAHRVAPRCGNLGNGRAHNLALFHNDEDFVIFPGDQAADQEATIVGRFEYLDAVSASTLHAVLINRGALGVAGVRYYTYVSVRGDDRSEERRVGQEG